LVQFGAERNFAVFAALALPDPNHHTFLIDVLSPEVTQLGATDARRVEGHQYGALPKIGSAVDQPSDFVPAEHDGRLITDNLRQRGIITEQRPSQHLPVKEAQCSRLEPDTPGVQILVNEIKLILPNFLRA
jgi:hypothetical protein